MRVVLSLCVWSAYLLSCHFVAAETVNGTFKLRDKWPGEFGGEIRIHLTKTYRFGWLIYVTFDIPVSGFVVSNYFLIEVAICKMDRSQTDRFSQTEV